MPNLPKCQLIRCGNGKQGNHKYFFMIYDTFAVMNLSTHGADTRASSVRFHLSGLLAGFVDGVCLIAIQADIVKYV